MHAVPKVVAAAVAVASVVALNAQGALPTPAGDAAAGQALFEGKGGCTGCHSIDNQSGILGPDLSWIGLLRTPAALRRSLTDPAADIHPAFRTVVVETKAGNTFEGLALGEDDLSIQIRDKSKNNRSFMKAELKDLRREDRSLMPSYATRLSEAEIDQLVAFLRTRRTLWRNEVREREREIAPASENAAFFNRPERDAEERTDELIEALEIPEGARVADLGAGTGYFTWRLAQRVGPRGSVIASDIQQQMLDATASTVRQHNLTNVTYVLASEADPRLPPKSLDVVFIGYAYHEFSDPEVIMSAVRRSLVPGGRVVVVEYAKENRNAPASSLHKMSFDEIRGELDPMGFELDRILDFLPFQHGLIFTVRP